MHELIFGLEALPSSPSLWIHKCQLSRDCVTIMISNMWNINEHWDFFRSGYRAVGALETLLFWLLYENVSHITHALTGHVLFAPSKTEYVSLLICTAAVWMSSWMSPWLQDLHLTFERDCFEWLIAHFDLHCDGLIRPNPAVSTYS